MICNVFDLVLNRIVLVSRLERFLLENGRKGMEKTALRDACTNGREGTASVAGTVLRDNVRKRVESCTRYVCVSE